MELRWILWTSMVFHDIPVLVSQNSREYYTFSMDFTSQKIKDN